MRNGGLEGAEEGGQVEVEEEQAFADGAYWEIEAEFYDEEGVLFYFVDRVGYFSSEFWVMVVVHYYIRKKLLSEILVSYSKSKNAF